MTPAVDDLAGAQLKRPSRTDAVGWLQLAGTVPWVTAAFAFVAVRLVADARGENAASAIDWWIALGIALVLGLGAAFGLYATWHRRDGQRLARLARRAWRTGTVPESLPLRIAVLRDFERRDKELGRQVPTIVLGVVWTIYFILQIATHHSPIDVAGWLLVWSIYIALTVRDVIDRRRWPELRRLIAELRDNPVHMPEAEQSAPLPPRA